ncbi:type II toxin-antitoxin system antitoxin SocA domain-containing protein [uncultured Rhodospira sp.]|uniref:Panacea domain-containing protein n=1 Tax=uncultured Rhodospira sp. TaxID=1936189 RepID=UPI00261C06D4|nr:type II toxin-antitoxin system antitoxin SocA domain-containing protein [uncultured Rhodospira sp.]
MGTVTPIEVSNAFLAEFGKDGITHMKLQKLTYLFHGFWLQEHDDRALSVDPEVWQYGPVFGSLYQAFKRFRATPIFEPRTEIVDFDQPSVTRDPEHLDLARRIWAKYGNMTGGQLSDLTHKPGSPWHVMARRYDFRVPQGLRIPEDLIRDHYRTEIPRLTG